MADVKESALTQQSDCKWVRALDANGNSIRISKEDLASVVGGLLSSSKLYPYMNRGQVANFDTATKSGMYLIGDAGRKYPGNPGIEYGTLEVFAPDDGRSTFVTQVAHNVYPPKKSYRRTFSSTTGKNVEWIEV